MKKTLIITSTLFSVVCWNFVIIEASAAGSRSVRGYTTSRGTYVAPHRATNPNRTKLDNWSTKGNVNPYTGKAGTKSPF